MTRSRFAAALAAGLVVVSARPLPAQAPATPTAAFAEQVAAHFRAWDRDGNGELSKAEIDAAVADPKVTGSNAAAVAALKRTVKNTKFKLPPLTEANVRKLATDPPAGGPELGKLYVAALEKIAHGERELFAHGPPALDTVHQGKLGDCFCLAPLGAMLHRDPKEVAALFHKHGDGTYTVALGKEPIRVPAPTDAEMAIAASTEHNGMWVNVYEKAVGVCRIRDKGGDEKTEAPLDAASKGGSAGSFLEVLTGHKMVRFSCKFAKEKGVSEAETTAKLKELRGLLEHAFREKRLVTCGTVATTVPGMTPNHAYAVIGYDAKTDHIKLWNPHGDAFTPKGPAGLTNGYPRKDGMFEMPLPEYVKTFAGLAFELNEPLAKK